MLTMYLAGSIRDNRPEDIAWREQVIDKLYWLVEADQLRIISPLGGKQHDFESGVWTVSGAPSTQQHIITQDFWSVDRSDIIIFNFLALSEKYPSIGTLVEFGRSTSSAKLRYVIARPGYKGHENAAMYAGIHPFIAHNATQVFDSVDACIAHVNAHVPVLSGVNPWYGKRVEAPAHA